MEEMSKNFIFLRNKCSSKNEIIKILLDDEITTNTKTFSYIYPKKVSKPSNYNKQFDIATNRFDRLTQEDEIDVDDSNVITNKNNNKSVPPQYLAIV